MNDYLNRLYKNLAKLKMSQIPRGTLGKKEMEIARSPWKMVYPRIPRNSRIAGCISAACSFANNSAYCFSILTVNKIPVPVPNAPKKSAVAARTPMKSPPMTAAVGMKRLRIFSMTLDLRRKAGTWRPASISC